MLKQIVTELRKHSPFTAFGAFTGIMVALLFQSAPSGASYTLFYVLHPLHVVLSALVTASMYKLHTTKGGTRRIPIWGLLAIGYLGSIGIATLSDSVIPFVGEALLRMPNQGIHLGFIEKWWLVNPLALAGVA
jgi:hypothetical protein